MTTAPTTHSLVKVLQSVPDLAGLDQRSLLAIVGCSTNLWWADGSTIFGRGDPAEALYIVLSGRVRIFDDGSHDVADVGSGAFIGEHALLLDTIHSKTAEAMAGTELMVVPRESFQSLLADNPDLAKHLRRRLDQRLDAERARES
jgi:CRP-like cAMP-binding protein